MRASLLVSACTMWTACSEPRAQPPQASAPLAAQTATAAPPALPPPAHEGAAPRTQDNAPVGVAPSRIDERSFTSAALGVEKRYLVYLPRGYADSTHRFPVVYMLHGLGGDETNWVEHGKLREAADGLGLAAIVVMPDGDDSFYVNRSGPVDYAACMASRPPWSPREPPARYCVRAPRYEDYIVKDLVADVDATYRTRAARRSRGIGGLSMGGFGALSLAMRHLDVFSAAASHSGAIALLYSGPHPYRPGAPLATSLDAWGTSYQPRFRDHIRSVFGPDIARWRAHDPAVLVASLDPSALAIHIDCGTSDEFRFEDHAAFLNDALAARGVPHELKMVPGGHNFDVWQANLPGGLAFFAAHLER